MTRMSSPKLVAVGDNCLDAFLTRDVLAAGGNALNVAAQWRRNGWGARYFGVVGPDREGEIMLAEIEAVGLAREDVDVRPGDTAVTMLRDRLGDRTFLLESLGVGENYMPSRQAFDVIEGADWVHLGTNSNPDLVRRLAADRVPFSIDISTRHHALPLDGVPLVFASGSDASDFDPRPLIAHLKGSGARQAIVTCGGRGAFFDDGARLHDAAATPVEVVDTCGAGDSFIATFITAFLIEDKEADAALAEACAAAGRTCTHLGGFPQELRRIPDWLPAKYAETVADGGVR